MNEIYDMYPEERVVLLPDDAITWGIFEGREL